MPTGWFGGDLDTVERTPVTGWWAEISQNIAPAGRTLTLTGGTPDVRVSKTIVPGGATLTVTGGQPTVTVTQHRLIQPAGGTLTLVGSHPALGLTLRPGDGALTLTGGQPNVTTSDHKVIQPGGATLALTGGTPNVAATAHKFVTPTGAPLALTGGQPVVTASDHKVIQPAGGTLALSGGTPTAQVGIIVATNGGTLALAGGTPTVATPVVVTPTGGTLTLIGSRPALGLTLRPGGGPLTLTGGQPSILLSDNKVYTPAAAPLALTGGTPVVTVTDRKLIVPSAPTITLAGGTPAIVLSDNKLYTPTGAPLALTGGQPVVTASDNQIVLPSGGTLSLTGGQPTVTVASSGPVPPTLIGATAVAGTGSTGTMPTHAIGDQLVAFAYLPASVFSPPAVTGWINAVFGTDASFNAVAVYTRIATATNTTHPTITGASMVGVQSWRGAGAVIGTLRALGSATTAGATITYPALNVLKTNSTSYLLRFSGAPSATNMTTNIPTGHTLVNGLAAGMVGVQSTSPPTANATTATQSISPSSTWLALTTELLSSDTTSGPVIMGSQAAVGATVPIPQHSIGDLIVISADRANNTQSTKPAASGTVPAWVDIDAATGTNTRSIRTAYFVATATNHTSGTWTNAANMTATVIRGQFSTPIGGHGIQNNASSTNCTAPAITLTNTDGSSLILAIHGTTVAANTPPSGYARINENSGVVICVNGKTVTTSVTTAVQVLASAAANSAAQIEIRSH